MLTHTIVEDLMVNEHETISQAHYGNMLSRSHSHLKKEAWLLCRMKVFLYPREDMMFSMFFGENQLTTRW